MKIRKFTFLLMITVFGSLFTKEDEGRISMQFTNEGALNPECLALLEVKQEERHDSRKKFLEFLKRQNKAMVQARQHADEKILKTLAIDYIHLTPGDLIELKKAITYLIKAQEKLQLTRNAQAVFDSILEQSAKINQAGVERRGRMNEDIWEKETLDFLQNVFELIQKNAKPVEQIWGVPRQIKYKDEELVKKELES